MVPVCGRAKLYHCDVVEYELLRRPDGRCPLSTAHCKAEALFISMIGIAKMWWYGHEEKDDKEETKLVV